MSINVSYHQLRKGDIVPDMLKKLEQFAMPPSSLTLELTESYFMKEEESRKALLAAMRQAVAADPVKTVLVDMTPLGLVELTRKKIRRPLHEQVRV